MTGCRSPWQALLLGLAGSTTLTGCLSGTDRPLVFGKIDTLGISAAAGVQDQGAAVTLGYRSAKVAVVPVTLTGPTGVELLGEQRSTGDTGAFSTFAHFQATAGAPGAGPAACLGDTFATGLAAQVVAGKLNEVCHPAAP